ncbi:hypothetical protein BAMA_15705 [Bacillus manliponensis]|uniref:Uncharacterized protein n=1 Tax=Bacillus manliponensis TaxID=574376 RepID=A0A073JT11_9BACI|nr:hypothetical protein [Bacillus manliponensis]KEK17331.1 hypothetical protein BAMA_15705 [Bacillus manliponensis]
MIERVYSVASPPLFVSEKEYVVSVGSRPTLEKEYTFAIPVGDPFGKREREYPVSVPPNSRFKAVKDNEASVSATKITRAKGVLTDIVGAMRIQEVDATISIDQDAEIIRTIQADIVDSIQLTANREKTASITYSNGANGNPRTFSMEQAGGDKFHFVSHIYESDISVSDKTDKVDRTFNGSVDKNQIVKQKLREYAAEVDELPQWVAVARVLYGEAFYESIMASRTGREHLGQIDSAENTERNVKTLDGQWTEYDTSTDRKPKELAAVYEDTDLFDGMGTPVYLHELELLERIHKEFDMLPFEQTNEADRIKETSASAIIDEESFNRLYVEQDSIYNELIDSNRKADKIVSVIETYTALDRKENVFVDVHIGNSAEAARSIDTHYTNVDYTDIGLRTHDIWAQSIAKEITSNVSEKIYEIDVTENKVMTVLPKEMNAEISVKDLFAHDRYVATSQNAIDDSTKKEREMHAYWNQTEITHRHEGHISTVVLNDTYGNRTNMMKNGELLHLYDMDRNENEVNAIEEQQELMDGQGKPVYLHEGEVLAKSFTDHAAEVTEGNYGELERVFSFVNIEDEQTHKNPHEWQAAENESVAAEFCERTLITEVANGIDVSRQEITNMAVINDDCDLGSEPAKETIITELDSSATQRSFEGVMEDIHTFSREHFVKAIRNEIENASKLLYKDTLLIENDLFKNENLYSAVIGEANEIEQIEKEKAKLWLKHGRQSWWHKGDWKKTR